MRRRELSDRPNTLGISQPVLDALLERIETSLRTQSAVARSSVRIPFRRLSIGFTVKHADGSVAAMTVACRNISRGGVGLLHAAYMHVGTPCSIFLPRAGRADTCVPGVVVQCRHVGGRVHEIGVRFDESIEPRDFVAATPEDVQRVLDSIKPAEFACRARVWISDATLRRAVGRLFGLTRSTVEEHRGAEAPAGARPEVLVCELPGSGEDPSESLLRVAEISQGAPVVMILPDRSDATAARLAQFLPDSSVHQPLELVGMCRALVEAITFSGR